MKAEGAGEAINRHLEERAEELPRTVGGLRLALSMLPADMAIRISVQGSDVGVCELSGLDAKAETNELMIMGQRAS